MKIRFRYIVQSFVMIISIILAGCATQDKLVNEDVLKQNSQIKKLDTAFQRATMVGSEIFSPTSYVKVNNFLDNAIAAARVNKTDLAIMYANNGLSEAEILFKSVDYSRDILAEVIKARERAYKAGAKLLVENKINALDAELKDTAELIEKGKFESAKKRRPDLISEYSDIELLSLKLGTTDEAKAVIVTAIKNDADEYAPKTLQQAREEVALAASILDADRKQVDKAGIHTRKSIWLAQQSISMTEIIKDFERRGLRYGRYSDLASAATIYDK